MTKTFNLANWPRSKAVVDFALKKGELRFAPQAYEKETREDGTLVREGYTNEDITGFWTPASVLEYFKLLGLNFTEWFLEFADEPFLKRLYLAFKYTNFRLPWSGWVWTLDSKATIKYFVVDEKRANTFEEAKSDYLLKHYEEEANKVTAEEINKYLQNHYHDLGHGLFASHSDPTVICFDPAVKPYALKDGWSTEQVGEILTQWLAYVSNKTLKARLIKDASW